MDACFFVVTLFSACASESDSSISAVEQEPLIEEHTEQDAVGPTPTPNILPSPTIDQSILIITPIPLPTTVPNQPELLRELSEDRGIRSVDFVIDTTILEAGRTPFQFLGGENWYKYSSPDGSFSLLIPGGANPDETSVVLDKYGVELEGQMVNANSTVQLEQHGLTYFDLPTLASGELKATDFLDDFAELKFFDDGIAEKFDLKMVEQTEIQLDGFPGLDIRVKAIDKEHSEFEMELHIRIYIVENTVYQLTSVGSWGLIEDDSQFMNSFTLNRSLN